MKFRSISKKDYELLLKLDRKVYPTDNPVTSEILSNWYKKNPEFGMIFEDDKGELEGVCISIPLNKNGWNKLINGKLSEADLNSKTLFDNSRDKEIGLHIYHIERLSDRNDFYKDSLNGLNDIIQDLRKINPSLKIIGFSGLCVTPSGIGLFYNKFNCRERKFVNQEHIFRKEGKLKIFNINSYSQFSNVLKEGYEYLNRCKMLVLYPDEFSLIWDYLS